MNRTNSVLRDRVLLIRPNLRDTAICYFGLMIMIFEITIISVDKFLITCLVYEILKAKKDKDTSHPPSWIFKNVYDVTTG